MISSIVVSTAGGYQQSRPLAVECWGEIIPMEDLAEGYGSGRVRAFPRDKTASYRKRNTNRSAVKNAGF